MKTHNSIIVDKDIDTAWRVMADEFNENDKWMADVYKTNKAENEDNPEFESRNCELTPTLDGLSTHENIIEYDKENYRLVFNVAIRNGGKLPVNGNVATITLKKLGDNETRVNWDTTPDLQPKGKLLAPLLKFGFQKTFRGVLEEFKHYVETGKPHPRKVEAMKKMVK